MTLVLRRRSDGKLEVQGDLPVQHEFPMSFLARELGGLVDVRITVHTDAGDIDYEMTGFPTEDGAEQPNYSALTATLATDKRKKRKAVGHV